ncbi:importin subunit beta-1-like [Triticum dicoccoides]|uniref:importin subunit beta-1-like n=1 Tax=Triticum dicoccoides TaxID=85692 RepID=UPI00188FC872|nr:importin subunit beta-1-like [Triticum dicoccoides]
MPKRKRETTDDPNPHRRTLAATATATASPPGAGASGDPAPGPLDGQLIQPAMDNITQILKDAQDPDNNIRLVAECKLKQLQERNRPNFLLSLSAELSSDASPPECRRLAGIMLKNSVEGKYSEDNSILIEQWNNLDQRIKSQSKESLLITLGSLAPQARHASSQIIGRLAYIEIPSQRWQDLIGRLLHNMAPQGASPATLKQATLEALEYVFEEKTLRFEKDTINGVLDAVIRAMNHQAEKSFQVRVAAVKALQNVHRFADFASDDDCRNRIMTAISDAAKSDEAVEVKHAAFGCLTAIASKYYMELEPYMETTLSLTTEALGLEGGVDETAVLECIEFWSTICRKVIKLREKRKRFPRVILTADCHFLENPLCSLVPLLLQTLSLHQGRDVDELNIFMSAMTCLGLVARTIRDAVVPFARQFIEGNIKVADWRSRKTAISVLGVILEGPSIEKLAPVVGLLMDKMEDPHMEIRGTATCTLGQVFELLHSPALDKRFFTNEDFPRIMAALSKRGKDVPEVSKEVCEAIYFLARGYDVPISSEVDHSKKKISSELSPFLSGVIDAILSASELDKKTPFGLPASASAYGALIEIVRVSNIWDFEAVIAIMDLMPRIMRRLNTALDAKAISSDDKTNRQNLQALLCDVLHAIIEKLGNSLHADKVRESAQSMSLQFCRVLTCDCSTARDKAALAIGALARAVGPKFLDHMPIFLQYYSVKLFSPIYLEVIGTIFHVLGDEILPCCDDMMDVLYEGLSKPKLKPQILACFGEIALAIGKHFEEYHLQAVRKKLKEAANPRYYANVSDEDKVDYGNQLIQGICKAYSGILRGIKDQKSGLKVAADLVEFIEAVSEDESRDARVTSAAVDVLDQFGFMAESWKKGLISELGR